MKTNDDGPEEDRGTLPSRKDRKDDAGSIDQDESPTADAADGDHSSPLMAEEDDHRESDGVAHALQTPSKPSGLLAPQEEGTVCNQENDPRPGAYAVAGIDSPPPTEPPVRVQSEPTNVSPVIDHVVEIPEAFLVDESNRIPEGEPVGPTADAGDSSPNHTVRNEGIIVHAERLEPWHQNKRARLVSALVFAVIVGLAVLVGVLVANDSNGSNESVATAEFNDGGEPSDTNGDTNGDIGPAAECTPSLPERLGDSIPSSAWRRGDVDGSSAVVASNEGHVRFYDWNEGWMETLAIDHDDVAAYRSLVAYSNGTAAVLYVREASTPEKWDGVVSVYERSGQNWTRTVLEVPELGTQFGRYVAMDSNLILVSGGQDFNTCAQSLYLFERKDAGELLPSWEFVQSVDLHPDECLGRVEVDGNVMGVTSVHSSGGNAYLYEYDPTTGKMELLQDAASTVLALAPSLPYFGTGFRLQSDFLLSASKGKGISIFRREELGGQFAYMQDVNASQFDDVLFAQSMAVSDKALAVGGERVYLFMRQHEGVPFFNSEPLVAIERPENEQGIFARHMELSNNHLLVSTGAGDAVYVMNITSCMGLEPRVAAPLN
ncbi:hypothetical protein ACHAXT_003593 [Thalassiosira profunda]